MGSSSSIKHMAKHFQARYHIKNVVPTPSKATDAIHAVSVLESPCRPSFRIHAQTRCKLVAGSCMRLEWGATEGQPDVSRSTLRWKRQKGRPRHPTGSIDADPISVECDAKLPRPGISSVSEFYSVNGTRSLTRSRRRQITSKWKHSVDSSYIDSGSCAVPLYTAPSLPGTSSG